MTLSIGLMGPSPPLRGGISLFNDLLRKSLQKEGVMVVMLNYIRQYPSIVFPGTSELMSEHLHQTNTKSASMEHDPCNKRVIDTCNPLTWYRAIQWITRYKIDVLIIAWWHPWFLPSTGYIAGEMKKRGVKVYFLCHNFQHHGSTSAFWQYSVSHLFKQADGIIFLSNHVRRGWKDRTTPVQVIFHPIMRSVAESDNPRIAQSDDNPIYKSIIPSENRVGKTEHDGKTRNNRKKDNWQKNILMAGYVRQYKGIEYALKLLEMDTEIHLTVAGEFYQRDLLYHAIEQKKRFTDQLTILPIYISNDHLNQLIDTHDMLICPYINPTQSGIVALAMGRNRPVAAFPSGALPEQISDGKTGILAKTITTDGLKQAVDLIYSEPLECWASRIEEENQKFSWTLFVSKLLDFIA